MPRRPTPRNEKLRVVDGRQHPFSMLYHAVIDDYGAELKPHGLATYWALVRRASNKDGTCYPSHQDIADKIGCSIAQVKLSLKRLADLGLIRITMRRPRTSVYTILDVPKRLDNSQVVAIQEGEVNSYQVAINRQVVAINSQDVAIEQLPGSYELNVVELDSPNENHPTTPPRTPPSEVTAPIRETVVEVVEAVAIAQGEETTATDGGIGSDAPAPFEAFFHAYPSHQAIQKARQTWGALDLDAMLPTILEALSWQKTLTGTSALPMYPHVYLQNKGWLDARPVAPSAREPEPPRCTVRDCPNPPEPTLSDTKCEMHAMATINEEAIWVIMALKKHDSDAPIDELEDAVWGEVSHYHKNGDWHEVMQCVTTCYQSIGDQLMVEFLAQEIARVVAEYRAVKSRVQVSNVF